VTNTPSFSASLRLCASWFFPLLFFFSCNDFNNPFDPNSNKQLADSTLVNYVTRTLIDTTVTVDTLIHGDTILITQTRTIVDSTVFVDTVLYYDIQYETTTVYDSVGYIDSLTVYDTVWYADTSLDTVPVYDSIGYIDTLTIYDTAWSYDTNIVYHTHLDTVTQYDTTVTYDTTTVLDTSTILVYDTTFVHDTLFDTLFFSDTHPLLRLLSYPDSTALSSYVPDSQYQLTYLAAGIDPGIITATAYRTCAGACVWNTAQPPWTSTFTGPTSHFYIRLTTDSGTFIDTFSLYNRHQQPTFYRLEIAAGPFNYDRNASAGFSACTIYTQDTNYGSNGNDFVLTSLFFYVQSAHPSCGADSYWEFYWSWDNNFSTSADHISCGSVLYTDPSLPLEDMELYPGLNTLNVKARCCASPPWSDWHIINIYVLAGPKP